MFKWHELKQDNMQVVRKMWKDANMASINLCSK